MTEIRQVVANEQEGRVAEFGESPLKAVAKWIDIEEAIARHSQLTFLRGSLPPQEEELKAILDRAAASFATHGRLPQVEHG